MHGLLWTESVLFIFLSIYNNLKITFRQKTLKVVVAVALTDIIRWKNIRTFQHENNNFNNMLVLEVYEIT